MALIIEVKVVPGSSKQDWKLESGRLKCFLKSAPEKNKANNELIQLLAHATGIPGQKIAIISGATARLKRISIEGELSFDRLLTMLGIDHQRALF